MRSSFEIVEGNGKVFVYEKTHKHARFSKVVGSEGYDMAIVEDANIPPHGRLMVDTGIRVAFHKDHYGILTHRSSFGAKTDGIIKMGIIDNDYRGNIKVVIQNLGANVLRLTSGMVLAQLVLAPRVHTKVRSGTVTGDTDRGEGGFGSTD